ncbi:hypothetical protein [Cardiobacterium hominis]|nr:hypothetical protein [Cardiobacterium hominis]
MATRHKPAPRQSPQPRRLAAILTYRTARPMKFARFQKPAAKSSSQTLAP